MLSLLVLSAVACGDGALGGGTSGGLGPTTGAGAGSGASGGAGGSGASGPGGGAGGSGAAGSGGGGGGFVPVDPPTCVDPSTLPSWRQGMAIGEWKRLESADITEVTPDVMPGGGYYGRIDAWNGFATDTTTSKVYLGAAGGHGDYAGNEVYVIDLNDPAPQWVIERQPSPASTYTWDQAYYTDDRPSPTHTYYTLWFIEQRGKLFRFAGAATWGSGNGGSQHIDAWDPVSKDWDAPGTHPDMGPSPHPEKPTAKDVLTGDVYQVHANNRLYRWNAETDTVDDLGEAQGGGGSFYELYSSPSVVDVQNGRLLFFLDLENPGAARVYDLASGAWSTAPFTGPAASAVSGSSSQQGMAYFDVCAEAIVYKTGNGGDVYWIDPATLEATPLSTSGSEPPNSVNGPHTLFQYVPKLGGYAYQASHESKLYFLATQ